MSDTGGVQNNGPVVMGFDSCELFLGDVMRGERATRGKALSDVQEDLKIRASIIAAIEDSDLSAFGVTAFIPGQVRSYARYLGLDPEETFQKFCEESGYDANLEHTGFRGTPKVPSANVNAEKGKAGVISLNLAAGSFLPSEEKPLLNIAPGSVGSFITSLLVVLLVLYGGWVVLNEVQRVSVSLHQDRATEVVGVVLGNHDTEARGRNINSNALDFPVLTPRDGPIVSIKVPRAVSQEIPHNIFSSQQAVVERIDGATPQVSAVSLPAVDLLAQEPAWVQVTSVDGTVLLEGILEAGERWNIPVGDGSLTLRSGNAGRVFFVVGEQFYGPLSRDADVVKNVVLSYEDIILDYSAVDLVDDSFTRSDDVVRNFVAEP